MKNIDHEAARALVDAGYMPASDYFRMFGDEVAETRGGDATRPESEVRKPPWTLPARFANVRGQSYRVVYRARSNATRGERPQVWSDARRRG
jgi:hypothetical protein